MGPKVEAIRAATGDEVGVFEGWGGMYMLELMPYGIRGSVPALGPADLLAKIWRLGQAGQTDAAFDIFQFVLPQIVFGLQNMEVFHHFEKRLHEILDPVVPDAKIKAEADFFELHQWIKHAPVDLLVGIDGAVYVLTRGNVTKISSP